METWNSSCYDTAGVSHFANSTAAQVQSRRFTYTVSLSHLCSDGPLLVVVLLALLLRWLCFGPGLGRVLLCCLVRAGDQPPPCREHSAFRDSMRTSAGLTLKAGSGTSAQRRARGRGPRGPLSHLLPPFVAVLFHMGHIPVDGMCAHFDEVGAVFALCSALARAAQCSQSSTCDVLVQRRDCNPPIEAVAMDHWGCGGSFKKV